MKSVMFAFALMATGLVAEDANAFRSKSRRLSSTKTCYAYAGGKKVYNYSSRSRSYSSRTCKSACGNVKKKYYDKSSASTFVCKYGSSTLMSYKRPTRKFSVPGLAKVSKAMPVSSCSATYKTKYRSGFKSKYRTRGSQLATKITQKDCHSKCLSLKKGSFDKNGSAVSFSCRFGSKTLWSAAKAIKKTTRLPASKATMSAAKKNLMGHISKSKASNAKLSAEILKLYKQRSESIKQAYKQYGEENKARSQDLERHIASLRKRHVDTMNAKKKDLLGPSERMLRHINSLKSRLKSQQSATSAMLKKASQMK